MGGRLGMGTAWKWFPGGGVWVAERSCWRELGLRKGSQVGMLLPTIIVSTVDWK
jgi:hypothetical protein